MNRYKNIQDELKALESGLQAGLKPVFNLPEGYFENFADTVMARIHATEMEAKAEISTLSPLLASISREMPLSVPDKYFTKLTPKVEESGKVLETIGKAMPYEVPSHYFEDLADAIQSRVWKPKAKVVTIRRRVIQMAAAAIITGIIAVSGWVYFSQNGNGISVNETGQWVTKKLDGVTNQELEEFINTTSTEEVSEPLAAAAKPEIRNMLTDVTDSELDNFLADLPEEEELSFN